MADDYSAPECVDGSFEPLPADDYLVHVGNIEDHLGNPVYNVTREEDINIGNGDQFVPQIPPPSCAGALHQVDVADIGDRRLPGDDDRGSVRTVGRRTRHGRQPDDARRRHAGVGHRPMGRCARHDHRRDRGGPGPHHRRQRRDIADRGRLGDRPRCHERLRDRRPDHGPGIDPDRQPDVRRHRRHALRGPGSAAVRHEARDAPQRQVGRPDVQRLHRRARCRAASSPTSSTTSTSRRDPSRSCSARRPASPFAPVGIYDYREPARSRRSRPTTTASFDVLLPSTNRINCPTPSGVCANLYRFVGNDPGDPGRD